MQAPQLESRGYGKFNREDEDGYIANSLEQL